MIKNCAVKIILKIKSNQSFMCYISFVYIIKDILSSDILLKFQLLKKMSISKGSLN